MVLLLLLSCLSREAQVAERLVGAWCGFWGCTGVDPATEWCHGKYDELARLHQERLVDLGYVLDEDAVDTCVIDMGGGPEDDGWCNCGGCSSSACCACSSNPLKALDHLHGVPPGTRFQAGE